MFILRQFQTSSLKSHVRGDSIRRVLAAALNAVEPGAAVRKHLHENPLPGARRTYALGLGKAACAMTQALADEINPTNTLVITKHASPLTVMPATVIEGNHPVPGEASVSAGLAVIEFVSQLTAEDLMVCLISGGGSALMAAPRAPLVDLKSLTSAFLASGARIDEINIVRRHLDLLKGGGVMRFANGARIVNLLLSDVVNDPIEAIASGPTVPDPTTCADAISIIRKYNLLNKIPDSIVASLRETMKPDEPVFASTQTAIIASNNIALLAAQAQARTEGFRADVIHTALQGEATVVGRDIAAQFKELLKTLPRPFCLLAGGESTVTLKGNGKGGRNQELALAAVDVLDGLEDVMFISLATDGEDGSTDAAGAVVTGESAKKAGALGFSTADYLSRNDAYTFFDALDDLIRTGPSGTNVNDLILCFAS
ncbi:MAG: DUF4147 domain-containing protein [Chloroflexi bacterium]|nr:DUF4147 domain-containing protein [Chloroflexota bacterium]